MNADNELRRTCVEPTKHATYVHSGLAEVNQQAQCQARCLEIVEALRQMNVVEFPDSLQFDQDAALDEQVGAA